MVDMLLPSHGIASRLLAMAMMSPLNYKDFLHGLDSFFARANETSKVGKMVGILDERPVVLRDVEVNVLDAAAEKSTRMSVKHSTRSQPLARLARFGGFL